MVKKKILGIAGSPREKGNSETLLDWTLKAAEENGADVEKIAVRDYDITPCIECGGCDETGECVIQDDMQEIYPKALEADVLIIATPIFFMNAPAGLKGFIDRFQCVWIKDFKLKQPLREAGKHPKGVILALGATKGETLFNGLLQTVKCLYRTILVEYDQENSIFIRSVNAIGEIENLKNIKERAGEIGRNSALAD